MSEIDRIYQLIYISNKSASFTSEDIEVILASSEKNNSEKDVTGLLLELPHHFIQVLEGKPKNLTLIFDKICADNRHSNIRLVVNKQIRSREFGNWSLGFSNNLSQEEVNDCTKVITSFAQSSHFNTMQVSGIQMLLRSLT